MSSFQQCFFIKGGGGGHIFLRARWGWGISMIMVEVFCGLKQRGEGFDWLGGVA